MDLLLQCAKNYEKLLDFSYHFVIARKGIKKEFSLTFQKSDFHHVAGLHKLRDIFAAQRGSREELFNDILNGSITQALIEKSEFYADVTARLEPLCHLEEFLDSNQLIFKYNENVRIYSQIKAEYLLEGILDAHTLYLFLGSREKLEEKQMCRTFFPKTTIDYSCGQPRYTLLKKEKIRISDGTVVYSYSK
ncbi:PBECR4 domain-containing protein [uncultured Treponema sp.]|uniref:PBECR4 domain-containing protein n=1 Tax=uncultured Treponema sp. TaxID=162155 RepID=UPI0025D7AB27|nr:PBECR4 domain-containing protein [uncultured Treponema sp.]